MKKGRCGTMTHDDKRDGATTLFAALNVLDGKVIRKRHPTSASGVPEISAPAWIGSFPSNLQLRLVMDNY